MRSPPEHLYLIQFDASYFRQLAPHNALMGVPFGDSTPDSGKRCRCGVRALEIKTRRR